MYFTRESKSVLHDKHLYEYNRYLVVFLEIYYIIFDYQAGEAAVEASTFTNKTKFTRV